MIGDPRYYNLGRGIRLSRERRQLPKSSLARICGCTPQFIANVERGRSRPSPTTLRKIIKALGLDPGRVIQAIDKDLQQAKDKKLAKIFRQISGVKL